VELWWQFWAHLQFNSLENFIGYLHQE